MIRLAFALMLLANVASAQSVDPRIATQAVDALQAMLNLREAQMKLLTEDNKKQVEELRAKCGEPCKEEKKDANAAGTGK